VDLEAVGVRSYISEPDRGRRNWTKHPEARAAVYRNRRRIRGARGQRLLRQRGERLERPFAHLYETGRMRRVHLRGHDNILKRLLLHAGALNLGLLMRRVTGVGTPRTLQGRALAAFCALRHLLATLTAALDRLTTSPRDPRPDSTREHELLMGPLVLRPANGFTTGC
jgi:transposase